MATTSSVSFLDSSATSSSDSSTTSSSVSFPDPSVSFPDPSVSSGPLAVPSRNPRCPSRIPRCPSGPSLFLLGTPRCPSRTLGVLLEPRCPSRPRCPYRTLAVLSGPLGVPFSDPSLSFPDVLDPRCPFSDPPVSLLWTPRCPSRPLGVLLRLLSDSMDDYLLCVLSRLLGDFLLDSSTTSSSVSFPGPLVSCPDALSPYPVLAVLLDPSLVLSAPARCLLGPLAVSSGTPRCAFVRTPRLPSGPLAVPCHRTLACSFPTLRCPFSRPSLSHPDPRCSSREPLAVLSGPRCLPRPRRRSFPEARCPSGPPLSFPDLAVSRPSLSFSGTPRCHSGTRRVHGSSGTLGVSRHPPVLPEALAVLPGPSVSFPDSSCPVPRTPSVAYPDAHPGPFGLLRCPLWTPRVSFGVCTRCPFGIPRCPSRLHPVSLLGPLGGPLDPPVSSRTPVSFSTPCHFSDPPVSSRTPGCPSRTPAMCPRTLCVLLWPPLCPSWDTLVLARDYPGCPCSDFSPVSFRWDPRCLLGPPRLSLLGNTSSVLLGPPGVLLGRPGVAHRTPTSASLTPGVLARTGQLRTAALCPRTPLCSSWTPLCLLWTPLSFSTPGVLLGLLVSFGLLCVFLDSSCVLLGGLPVSLLGHSCPSGNLCVLSWTPLCAYSDFLCDRLLCVVLWASVSVLDSSVSFSGLLCVVLATPLVSFSGLLVCRSRTPLCRSRTPYVFSTTSVSLWTPAWSFTGPLGCLSRTSRWALSRLLGWSLSDSSCSVVTDSPCPSGLCGVFSSDPRWSFSEPSVSRSPRLLGGPFLGPNASSRPPPVSFWDPSLSFWTICPFARDPRCPCWDDPACPVWTLSRTPVSLRTSQCPVSDLPVVLARTLSPSLLGPLAVPYSDSSVTSSSPTGGATRVPRCPSRPSSLSFSDSSLPCSDLDVLFEEITVVLLGPLVCLLGPLVCLCRTLVSYPRPWCPLSRTLGVFSGPWCPSARPWCPSRTLGVLLGPLVSFSDPWCPSRTLGVLLGPLVSFSDLGSLSDHWCPYSDPLVSFSDPWCPSRTCLVVFSRTLACPSRTLVTASGPPPVVLTETSCPVSDFSCSPFSTLRCPSRINRCPSRTPRCTFQGPRCPLDPSSCSFLDRGAVSGLCSDPLPGVLCFPPWCPSRAPSVSLLPCPLGDPACLSRIPPLSFSDPRCSSRTLAVLLGPSVSSRTPGVLSRTPGVDLGVVLRPRGGGSSRPLGVLLWNPRCRLLGPMTSLILLGPSVSLLDRPSSRTLGVPFGPRWSFSTPLCPSRALRCPSRALGVPSWAPWFPSRTPGVLSSDPWCLARTVAPGVAFSDALLSSVFFSITSLVLLGLGCPSRTLWCPSADPRVLLGPSVSFSDRCLLPSRTPRCPFGLLAVLLGPSLSFRTPRCPFGPALYSTDRDVLLGPLAVLLGPRAVLLDARVPLRTPRCPSRLFGCPFADPSVSLSDSCVVVLRLSLFFSDPRVLLRPWVGPSRPFAVLPLGPSVSFLTPRCPSSDRLAAVLWTPGVVLPDSSVSFSGLLGVLLGLLGVLLDPSVSFFGTPRLSFSAPCAVPFSDPSVSLLGRLRGVSSADPSLSFSRAPRCPSRNPRVLSSPHRCLSRDP
ncbi:hypothetical protein C7M84_002152 [Penaeus vannamei]|uniref:Uncharacterized protein n=1 Tax=Penaeus vannamei TaxID=6689 RepID=A0A3R7PQ43_PENVA|nr:hypothetical protein C7M84_002152 [Penaeus vannamei]